VGCSSSEQRRCKGGATCRDRRGASGENPVTIQGYAPLAPTVAASARSVGATGYDAAAKPFTIAVTRLGTSAAVSLML
jgi:hypothetical protein